MKPRIPPLAVALRHALAAVGIIACVLVASLTPAKAWNGCYVGAHTGFSVADVDVAIAGFQDGSAATTGLIGVNGGCDWAVNPTWFVGAWGDFDFHGGGDSSPLLLGMGTGEVDRTAALGLRVGGHLTPGLALYVTGGYSWAWAKDVAAGPLVFNMPTFSGPTAGVGIEAELSKNLRLDVNYRATFSAEETIMILGTPAEIDPLSHTIRVGLRFTFGAPMSIVETK